MKKYLILIVSLMLTGSIFSQAKKPTLMVLPSDNWCITNGYSIEFDNQGIKEVVPDYRKAFQQSSELLLAISKINGLMADKGFPLKNAETVIKNINSTSALDNLRTSKDGGAAITESPVDQLLN